jgi:hypothetical protein
MILALMLAASDAPVSRQTPRLPHPPAVAARPLAAIPPEARVRETALLARITPDRRSFVNERAGKAVDAAVVRDDAITAFPGSPPADIEAIVFLVMMNAAKQADDDLRGIMGETNALRMQMAMDRRAKAMEALSNMMRKMSDTTNGIVQNIK